ncbi:hypothetical protein GQ457_03G032490 [Hibiscus cannabinus]
MELLDQSFNLGFSSSFCCCSSVLATVFVANSVIMGCGPSKVDDLPLVALCKERKELIKAASIHRSALAAAHVTYFHSLRDVGEAIRKFVDEELVVGSASSIDSPVLTLPSDEFKSSKKNKRKDDNHVVSSSSSSLSHSIEEHGKNTRKGKGESDGEGSHLDLSSGSPSISGSGSGSPLGHVEMDHSHSHSHSPDQQGPAAPYGYNYGYGGYGGYGYGYPYPPPQDNWGTTGNSSSYMYYMKKSATPSQSFVYQEPEGQYGYSSYTNGGFFGYPSGSPRGEYGYGQRNSPPRPPQPPPAPPSPPRNSTWDFLNVFETLDNSGYPGYYPASRYGYGSTTSSPDSKEVREREGIPDLEDETEPEMLRAAHKEKRKMVNEEMNHNYIPSNNKTRNFGEGTSKSVPVQRVNGITEASTSTSKAVPSSKSESLEPGGHINISPSSGSADTIVTKSPEEDFPKNKRVSFEVEEVSNLDVDSSKLSSLTTLSVHGTRDLQEVVKEIKDEFETASSYGKEVAVLLEVGKLPYQQRKGTGFRVIFSRMLYQVAPNMISSPPPPIPSIPITSRTMKMAKEYCQVTEQDEKHRNLSSTLEELYAWEKKLYKEVKDEERLRVIYERKCNKLRMLDNQGAESSKIDATRASIRKLLTKIDVCIKAVEAISTRIHKLRDEELHPQLTNLVYGLIRMWKSMLSCHQKQFQAIMETKVRSLRANTGFERDSGLKATVELEMELLDWCARFNNWINTQKAYVGSLYGWLMRCIEREQEITTDGVAPFSPGRVGAPPIFVICNDWYQAMDRVSEQAVANAMQSFASSLHQLWERQDEEQRRRTRAQYLSKDFEKRVRELRLQRHRMEQEREALSDKNAVSKVPSESGVSPLDDLKVDLDSMRQKLEEERVRHRDAIKLVNDAASSSLQAGLVPIFEALGNFTSEVLKAHEQVRLENAGAS